MCLIAFAVDAHEQCPLLIASNRDEYWHRPTVGMHPWHLPNGVKVYAGRDEQAGGTWLGFNEVGRVAMLTNVRHGAPDAAPRSRGELTTRWLAGTDSAPDWRAMVQDTDPTAYGGFNLVLGAAGEEWVWLSNRPHPDSAAENLQALDLPAGWHGARLMGGVYGLSNAGLDTPWPKTLALKAATTKAVQGLCQAPPSTDWHAPLLAALLNTCRATPAALPETAIGPQREHALSSAFVHIPEMGYGTRSSLIAHWNGQDLMLDEWVHDPVATASPGGRWPLESSRYSRLSISMWGMPTSS